MDPFMDFFDFSGADKMTISNDSPVVHKQNLSAIALHRHQLAEPSRTRTAEMTNVHNSPSVNVPQAMDQPAGSSPISKDQSNSKKLARQRSDLKYHVKKKQEMVDLKRKADELIEKK